MKKLRICLEIPGLAEDENGQPCPGGVRLTLGDDNAEEITGEAYRNLMKEINIAGILRMACLDGFCRPEDCRLLTPEEYNEKYGGGGVSVERLTMIDGIGNDELVRCMGCGLEKAGENLENCGFCEEGWQKALKKLAAYEDTGLDPEDLKKTFNEELLLTMTAQMMGITPERLRELAKADRDGRCLVLPCKVGDTVYVVGKIKVVEAVISEIYTLDSQKGVEYLVNFNCDENCKGCPFYAWEQSWEGEWSCDCGYGEGAIFQKDFGKTVFLTRDAAAAATKGEQHGK